MSSLSLSPSLSLSFPLALSDSSYSRLYSRGNERSVISCDKNERRSTFFLSSGGPAQRHHEQPYKTSPSSSAGGAAALTSRTSVRIVACGWSQPQQDSSRLVGKAIKGGGRLFHWKNIQGQHVAPVRIQSDCNLGSGGKDVKDGGFLSAGKTVCKTVLILLSLLIHIEHDLKV